MHFQLTNNIWFGNWESPIELKNKVKSILNVGHSFSERRGRHVYWENLKEMPWDTYYVRLAQKDHRPVNIGYLNAIENFANSAVDMGKTPILCHCQMGGHRGHLPLLP